MLATKSLNTDRIGSLALIGALALSSCGGGADGTGGAAGLSGESGDSAGEAVVERSTDAGVETVRNVSGSRWGRDATLLEELSIGEEIGDEPYLFGMITAAWATDDRIYVVDAQVPAVRAFDHQGGYLFDVGRTGQGPGEYSRPMALAVAGDGRVLVTDLMGARLNIYDGDGEAIEDRSLGSPQSSIGLQLSFDDEIFTRIIELPENMGTNFATTDLRMGMQRVGPDGLTGDPLFPPPIPYEPPTVTVEIMGREMAMPMVPFAPAYQWAYAPGGEMIVGVGDDYRFEIHAADGKTTIVEKTWDPIPVEAEEAAFRAEQAAGPIRRMAPDWKMDIADIPATKPAFTTFQPDRSRRVWVVRQGPGRIDPECTDVGGGGSMTMMIGSSSGGGSGGGGGMDVRIGDTGGGGEDVEGDCWASINLFDVFELASGEFLGTVRTPTPGFSPLFVQGDTVLAAVADDAGTVRLKKYRLQTGS